MRLRSGSVGKKKQQMEDEDSEHEPIQFSAKPSAGGGGSSVVVDPREIRITETSPDGDTGHAGLPPDSMFNVDMGGAAPSGVPPS